MDSIRNFLTQNADTLFLVMVFFCAIALFVLVFGIVSGAVGLRQRTAGAIGVATGSRASQIDARSSAHPVLNADRGGLRRFGGFNPLASDSQIERARTRKFLELAGFYGAAAPFLFQLMRVLAAVGIGLATIFFVTVGFPNLPPIGQIILSLLMTVLGFYLPKSIVSLIRDRRRDEHRRGFPDFLDLLVICTQAGVGMDAAIDRVSKDLFLSHPSLARNLYFATLELRAGRSLREALANLSERLGIDEARSFATLLQQSEELGASVVESLRVYSEEMRSKRLARAEEKAHGLPAKLVFPLGFCVFPVILAVTILPVALRIYKALGL